jgi:hypothetical protein
MPIISFKTRHGRVRFKARAHRPGKVPKQLRPYLFESGRTPKGYRKVKGGYLKKGISLASHRSAMRTIKKRHNPAKYGRQRMSMRDFIKENKEDIKAGIRNVLRDPSAPLSESDIREWIMNDEGLYNWARSSGVRV